MPKTNQRSQKRKSQSRIRLTEDEQSKLRQAQECVYDAWECQDEADIERLARKALELSPYCADAILLFSELKDSSAEARVHAAMMAMYAGAASLGDEFESMAGHFWGFQETRPFMRALQAHAEALRELTAYEAAVLDYFLMLELNPNDNQGVRYELLPLLVTHGQNEAAEDLHKKYQDDACVVWLFMGTLLDYLKNPEQAITTHNHHKEKQADRQAFMAMNDLLIGKKSFHPHETDRYLAWSEEEALVYYPDVVDAWESVDGALEWLKKQSDKDRS